MRKYRLLNRNRIRLQERVYWKSHPQEKKRKDALSYERHRDTRRDGQAIYSSTHREDALERVKRWRETNRERCNTINANRRARQLNAPGSHTTAEWHALKKQYANRCVHCGKSEPEIKLTRDHIIPLARGGSNYITNIQPLCGRCNCVKHAKMPSQYPQLKNTTSRTVLH